MRRADEWPVRVDNLGTLPRPEWRLDGDRFYQRDNASDKAAVVIYLARRCWVHAQSGPESCFNGSADIPGDMRAAINYARERSSLLRRVSSELEAWSPFLSGR